MNPSLVPRPLPAAAVEKSGLGMRLYEPHTRIWTTIEIFKEQNNGIKGVL